ncbi:MAG: hypothetical protein GY869_10760, partial [Planctomycetes bacterium]|nr:hypothetical protein [Planctomycetota bacterium]
LNISATVATPVDLSAALDAWMTYWYLSDIETAFDTMYVEGSVDGSSWINLAAYDEEDGAWTNETIALGGFCGASAFTFRFRFVSDGGYVTVGMLIDDLVIETSDEDNAAPLIVHNGPTFYEGVAGDFEVIADIIDISGVESASVIYTIEGGTEEFTVDYDHFVGDTYYFYIPAQEAGSQVDYRIASTDASANGNFGEVTGFVYIAGHHLIYDNGVVDFFTTAAPQNGLAVKMIKPAGQSIDCKFVLIRNYTDTDSFNDDMEIHVWADDNGQPGADLIEPFLVTPEATLDNTSPMTRVDLRPYAEQLDNIPGDFFIGFIVPTGGPAGQVLITITQPGNFANSFALVGGAWVYQEGTDYHMRGVVVLEETAVGTVQGNVTDADTGDPIEGATVTVGSYSMLTDAAGWYSIVVDPGDYTFTCEMIEYLPYVEELTVGPNETLTRNIELVH